MTLDPRVLAKYQELRRDAYRVRYSNASGMLANARRMVEWEDKAKALRAGWRGEPFVVERDPYNEEGDNDYVWIVSAGPLRVRIEARFDYDAGSEYHGDVKAYERHNSGSRRIIGEHGEDRGVAIYTRQHAYVTTGGTFQEHLTRVRQYAPSIECYKGASRSQLYEWWNQDRRDEVENFQSYAEGTYPTDVAITLGFYYTGTTPDDVWTDVEYVTGYDIDATDACKFVMDEEIGTLHKVFDGAHDRMLRHLGEAL